MTKEEALQVSRLTAYRIARHQGRTDADSQQVYDLDPETYILTAMAHYLTGSTDERRTKIETTQDAVELSLKVTSMLALAYHAEKHGGCLLPNPKEIDRLRRKSWKELWASSETRKLGNDTPSMTPRKRRPHARCMCRSTSCSP